LVCQRRRRIAGGGEYGFQQSAFSYLTPRSTFLSFFEKNAVILFIKAYVEMYAGKLKKQKVEYKNFPQSTHSVMVLLMLSSISFHLALWPVYRGKSMLIMFLLATFLLNFCLLMPSYVQNLAAFVLLTFFIQEYK
jgi:hypothetical protein